MEPDRVGGEPAAADLRQALDVVVRDSVRPVAGGLGILYAIYAVAHAAMLPPGIAPTMAGVATVSSAALGASWLYLGRRPLPVRWGQPVAVGMAGIVLANSFLHLFLTDDPLQTTNVALLIIGAGCFLLSVRWLAVVIACALGGWVVLWSVSASSGWPHFGFFLLAATVIALLVHAVRLRVFGRLARLRLRDARRQRELEGALEEVRWLNADLERRVTERTAALEAANRLKDESLARAEAARVQAEAADRAKDQFLAIVSHELRTPLSPILAWTHLLRGASGDAGQLRRGIETIERNARLEAQLIDDLLDVSRIRAGALRLERTRLDLRTVVASAVDTLAQEAVAEGVEVETRMPSEPVTVRGDAMRLQQVVWNLLANALKFSAPGDRVVLALAAERGEAVLTVSDSGAGIAPALLPGVFDPFRQGDASRTRSTGGLGLGLAIAKRLVDLHEGSIVAESGGLDQGACFTVRLPLVAGRIEGPPRPGARPRPSPLRVLLVDDSGDTLDGLRMLLDAEGYEVAGVPSGYAALAQLERVVPDVLVSDVAMPGMDGYTLLAHVRERPGLERLPAIAITGYASEAEAETALAAGYDAFLPKPVDPARLAELLEAVVTGRKLAGA